MASAIAARVDDEPQPLVPLRLLRAGQGGQVGRVQGSGDFLHRLREMGLRVGAEVCMLRPGRACIIRLDGQKLCCRCDDLDAILVCPGA